MAPTSPNHQVLSADIQRHVEHELRAYHDTRAAIEQRRLDLIGGGRMSEDDAPVVKRSLQWSDPTSVRGQRLADDPWLREHARIVDAIDAMLLAIPDPGATVVQRVFWRGESHAVVAGLVGCEVGEVTRLRRLAVVMVAGRLGWIG